MNKFWKDWTERVLWTAAQAVVGVGIVEVTSLSSDSNVWWAALLIPALSALKGLVAKKVGDPDTAALK